MSRYDPLRRYLAKLPAEQREVRISFHDLEDIVGTLPPSARNYRPWWGNSVSPQAVAWLGAGFCAAAGCEGVNARIPATAAQHQAGRSIIVLRVSVVTCCWAESPACSWPPYRGLFRSQHRRLLPQLEPALHLVELALGLVFIVVASDRTSGDTSHTPKPAGGRSKGP